jgi:hypothetical protein
VGGRWEERKENKSRRLLGLPGNAPKFLLNEARWREDGGRRKGEGREKEGEMKGEGREKEGRRKKAERENEGRRKEGIPSIKYGRESVKGIKFSNNFFIAFSKTSSAEVPEFFFDCPIWDASHKAFW